MDTESTILPSPEPGDAPEEIVPDYSRLGFRQLQALCKARSIPADGKGPALIEKLKQYDAEHGLETDTTLPEDDDDLLDIPDQPDSATDPTAHPLDAPAPPRDDNPQTPSGGGPGASLPPPDGTPPAVPGAPALTVAADPDAPKGLPMSTIRGGRPNLAVRDGLVKVGEAHGAAEVRAFRCEYPLGERELTDIDHVRFIEQTHIAAAAAGLEPKGGPTIGERIGYATDANGQRTVIYQVPLRRQH